MHHKANKVTKTSNYLIVMNLSENISDFIVMMVTGVKNLLWNSNYNFEEL